MEDAKAAAQPKSELQEALDRIARLEGWARERVSDEAAAELTGKILALVRGQRCITEDAALSALRAAQEAVPGIMESRKRMREMVFLHRYGSTVWDPPDSPTPREP